MVGGHLDSWDLATGAIDNGIGSFSVLDMARTFQALKLNPARTVEFILFMGEEEGLLGSKAYVAAAKNDKSIDQIKYMFNYDMTNDPKGFSTSSEDSRALFQNIGAIANKIDTNFKIPYPLAQDCTAITNHSCCRVFQLVEVQAAGYPMAQGHATMLTVMDLI